MDITTIEKLNNVFLEEGFVKSIEDLDNLDDIYSAVAAKDMSVSRNDLEEYLKLISRKMDSAEISEEELSDVAGGVVTFSAAAAVIGAVALGVAGFIGMGNTCYTAGNNFGKFLYNLTHR